MKFRELFEMPERIQQEEIQMPWKSADTSKKLWAMKLRGVPGAMIACHPVKNNAKQRMIIAYMQVNGGYQAACGILAYPEGKAYRIDGVSTMNAFKGNNLAFNMYSTIAFDKGVAVISDDVQTDGGAAIWKKLSQQFPGHVGATEGEVEDAVDVTEWKDGDPFTHAFTRLVLSPTGFRSAQVA